MKKLRHPFITQILDTFETETHILIVMEYICGDLLGFVRKRAKLSENTSKIIFKQIIEGLKFIHSNKIVHRDIKLDNILIDLSNTVKICDFGVSRRLHQGDVMHEHCGTPAYIAPEIFENNGYEGYTCDIWSAGVTLYYMLSGVQPFKGNNLSSLQKVIKQGEYQKLKEITPEALSLIDGMLQIDPKKRLSINQILNHPWLVKVNLKNRNEINLFTKAEKILLSKYNVDYLNSPKEELIENFTIKNLDTIAEEKKNYGNTKSLILAPFNSYDNSNISHLSRGVKIENNICKFCGKVKQINIKYELNNNSKFDNGIIISFKESKGDSNNDPVSNNSISKPISQNVENNEKCFNNNKSGLNSPRDKGNDSINFEILQNYIIKTGIINQIESEIGYSKKYLVQCIKKNEINYATATYYILNKNYSLEY